MKAGRTGLFAFATLLLWLAPAARAETSVYPNGDVVNTLIMGSVVDDPDPFGGDSWFQYSPLSSDQVLNPGGAARGDGPPDVFIRPSSWPVAVWAWNTGSDHDLALSEWNGNAWSPTEFLTSATADEIDPRVFVEPVGTQHVVWWTPGQGAAYTVRGASGPWVPSKQIAADAVRPSVAVLGGVPWVGYERLGANGKLEAVILRGTPGGWATEAVVPSNRSDRIDIVLHSKQGNLWAEWKHSADTFSCVEWDGASWSTPDSVAWTDATWVGVEALRLQIERSVYGD